jgi:hypothetical protein
MVDSLSLPKNPSKCYGASPANLSTPRKLQRIPCCLPKLSSSHIQPQPQAILDIRLQASAPVQCSKDKRS